MHGANFKAQLYLLINIDIYNYIFTYRDSIFYSFDLNYSSTKVVIKSLKPYKIIYRDVCEIP
jgi:hypothetical protein